MKQWDGKSWIIRTSSGVMKLGPHLTLQAPLHSGRVSEKEFINLDMSLKCSDKQHGGPVGQGLYRNTDTKNLTSLKGKGLYMHGRSL